MSKDSKLIKDLDPQMDQILYNDLNNRFNKFIEFIDLYSDNELEKTLSLICKELSKREVNNNDNKI